MDKKNKIIRKNYIAELRRIAELGNGKYRYNITLEARFEYFLRLYKINEDIFDVIRDSSGIIIAYNSIIPLTEDAYIQHILGRIDEFSFSKEHIVNGPSTKIYYQGFCIDQYALTNPLQAELINNFCHKVAQFMYADIPSIQKTIVYGIPFIEAEGYIFKNMEFTVSNLKSKHHPPIYELNFFLNGKKRPDKSDSKLINKIWSLASAKNAL